MVMYLISTYPEFWTTKFPHLLFHTTYAEIKYIIGKIVLNNPIYPSLHANNFTFWNLLNNPTFAFIFCEWTLIRTNRLRLLLAVTFNRSSSSLSISLFPWSNSIFNPKISEREKNIHIFNLVKIFAYFYCSLI